MRSRSILTLLILGGTAAAAVPSPALSATTKSTPEHRAALSFSISPKQHWLTVRLKTKSGATCKLTVSVHGKSASLPKRTANKSGKATFKWGVPLNAPSGRWTFSVRCTRAGKSYRLKKKATILTGGNGADALVEWSSLTTQTPGKGSGVPVVRVAVPDKRGAGDPGDDYPAELKNRAQDSVADQWGEYNRECTSFVAWALATRNGFNMPFYDDAAGWGPDARSRGFTVNSTASKGAVAWSPSGHVAYVQDVVGGQVHIEEYNHGYPIDPGKYSSRTVPAGNFQYIHFADVPAGSVTPSGPAPGSPNVPLGASWEVAFQSNDNGLWLVGSDNRGAMHLGMAPGTSPSVTGLSNGSWETAFQSNDNDLWLVGSDDRGAMHLGMALGTSPSITAMPNGSWEVAFQSNDNDLWLVGSDNRGAMHLGMAPGTSPSITAMPNGSWEVAFQSNDNDLWLVGSDDRGAMHLGMAPGTSPSITAMPNGSWEVAFQSNDNDLWLVGSDNRGAMHLGVASGTNPSVTGLSNGSWETAFEANDNDLWLVGSDDRGAMHLGMAPGTSPSITAMPNGSWETAFQSNDNDLWLVGSDDRGAMHLGMAPGTSPSITRMGTGG